MYSEHESCARSSNTSRRTLTITLVLFALIIGAANAQRFQYTYGLPGVNGSDGNAVLECANGDFIAAGADRDLNPPFPYMYIVRTDPNGAIVWDNHYKVAPGGIGVITDIEEYPNGDFVVVGWIDEQFIFGAGTRDPFVMRIDPFGNPIWSVRAAYSGRYSEARSVVITQFGNGGTTNAGDVVVAGFTSPPGGGTPVDGLLFRLDGNGNPIWEFNYDVVNVAGTLNDDELYSVAETRAINPGEIVAAGRSTDVSAGARPDVWVLRVDGNNGSVGAAPQGSATYGGVGTDEAYGVVELLAGTNPGSIALTGRSDSRPFPNGAFEILVMQLQADPCQPPIASEYFGDDGTRDEFGLGIVELVSGTVGTPGNVTVTGGTFNGAFGGEDAFLQEFQEATMVPVGAYNVYGGFGDEEGRSVDETPLAAATQGYIFTGLTTTPGFMPAGHAQNLYLVKTDGAGSSLCNSGTSAGTNASTGWSSTCATPLSITASTITPEGNGFGAPNLGFQICFSPFKVQPRGGGNDGVSGVDVTSGALSSLATVPNPVTRGTDMQVRYTLNAPAAVTITVADVLGNVVHRVSSRAEAGAYNEPVSTAGWATGSYVVKMTAGEHTTTTRVVVVDR